MEEEGDADMLVAVRPLRRNAEDTPDDGDEVRSTPPPLLLRDEENGGAPPPPPVFRLPEKNTLLCVDEGEEAVTVGHKGLSRRDAAARKRRKSIVLGV